MNSPSKKRLPPVSVRFSENQRALLAQRAGNLPLSTYIKDVLFSKAASPGQCNAGSPRPDQTDLAKILVWLGETQIAANLAILANAAESGSLDMSEPVTQAVMKACADIDAMRTALMRAMGKRPKMSDEEAYRAFDNAVAAWRKQRAGLRQESEGQA